jgi:hypothetical protein
MLVVCCLKAVLIGASHERSQESWCHIAISLNDQIVTPGPVYVKYNPTNPSVFTERKIALQPVLRKERKHLRQAPVEE